MILNKEQKLTVRETISRCTHRGGTAHSFRLRVVYNHKDIPLEVTFYLTEPTGTEQTGFHLDLRSLSDGSKVFETLLELFSAVAGGTEDGNKKK